MPHAASIPKVWDFVMTFIVRRLFCRRHRHRESAVKNSRQRGPAPGSFRGLGNAREDALKIGCFTPVVKRLPLEDLTTSDRAAFRSDLDLSASKRHGARLPAPNDDLSDRICVEADMRRKKNNR